MEVNLIVAIGRNGAIGVGGDLIWHIPADLKRFKSLTTGHPVIMGRKTWDSLPRRPLPGRKNIVITHNSDFNEEGAVTVSSPEEAITLFGNESPFIIGGGQIYNAMMPYVTKLYLTEVDSESPEADTFLHLNKERWHITEESEWMTAPDGTRYRYVDLVRKQ